MKIVHTADTHLGFEVTRTPIPDPEGRRRRARSVEENFRRVVQYALDENAHLFVHSGDLFNQFYLPRDAQDTLVQPFRWLAQAGIPVLIIPGNHERSQLPFDLFHGMRNVYVFDQPSAVSLRVAGYRVTATGFPFLRQESRRTFFQALAETEYASLGGEINLLVTHQAFDQAVVGPGNYVFRAGRRDTVSRSEVPTDFHYIAAGHIHRHQVLDHPRRPGLYFVYPGSVQRMSFAEREEEKGFVVAELEGGSVYPGFVPLPAHDMEIVQVEAAGLGAEACVRAIEEQYWRFREDLVIRFNLTGGQRTSDYPDLDYQGIRERMPPVMACGFALRAGNRWVHR